MNTSRREAFRSPQAAQAQQLKQQDMEDLAVFFEAVVLPLLGVFVRGCVWLLKVALVVAVTWLWAIFSFKPRH